MARRFGATWWGRAWIDALEGRARLDPNRLPRGRTYARQDRATQVKARPGEITALVQGSRRLPYQVRIGVRRFSLDEWQRLLEAIASRAGHAAALLDGELEPAVVEDAARAGVEILPGPGDLAPRCSCPDRADPCKHAAAVCYLMADELDEDPFALLLLRGRTRGEVLAELRRLRSSSAPVTTRPAETAPDGMRATEAWSRDPEELPTLPAARPRPSAPAPLPADPPAAAPFTTYSLRRLAADAARRAWSAYQGEGSSGLLDDSTDDLARRAGAALGTADWAELVAATGGNARKLARRAVAWQVAGRDGLGAVEQPQWRPDTRVMAAARQALVEAGAPPSKLSVRQNRLTVDDVQIRLTPDGRWWRFERRTGAWELAAPPSAEPDDLWW